MNGVPLLRIDTEVGSVQLRGPCRPPAGLMAGISIAGIGRLALNVDVGTASAEFLNPSGELRNWDVDVTGGPALFEQTTYQLYIVGTGATPRVVHRDPHFTRDLTSYDDQYTTTGMINLRGQIGLLDLVVQFGRHRLRVQLEVLPTKLDYARDYAHLTADVAAAARGLALAYLRSTHRRARRTTEPATDIEWLTALRQEITDLQQALALIERQPHRQLLREPQSIPNHRIRRIDAVSRRSIRQGRGDGPVDRIPGVGPVRRVINSVVATTTLDTPEHRWLNLQLQQTALQLQTLAASIKHDPGPGSRRSAERCELDQLSTQVKQLLDASCLVSARQLPQPSPPSLILLSAPGYRDAYRILTSLRLGLALGGNVFDLQSKDVHELYELWTFLEVINVLRSHAAVDVDSSTIIQSQSGGLRVGLREGIRSDITLTGDPRSFTLSYNRTYPGDTGDQRPDIVIKVSEPDQPDLIVVLDAKYRVDATGEYRKRHGAPGPPIDAINALHRYRDAITIRDDPLVRPVVRCVALFPLTSEEVDGYERHSKLYRSLNTLGIGALPFLPGNTDLAAKWITESLSLPISDLAWDGPRRNSTLANP